ncbi:MAG: hypothetical protein CH6_4433 [Candidatus Kapaibacterium sp.]|nr:MAG: hypothetical protein CH6_4433 [Candidatus Kapabacteria bacterium]
MELENNSSQKIFGTNLKIMVISNSLNLPEITTNISILHLNNDQEYCYNVALQFQLLALIFSILNFWNF